jgi:lipopolysaccharide/colanic/teichoic acid biosynthesis glycosyltransferase
MSLIGPRPEVPEYVDPEDLLWRGVLVAKPGITDLASLIFRNEEEVLASAADPEGLYRQTILPAKLCLNLQYIRSRRWRLDLKLLLLTAYYSFCPWTFDRQRIEMTFFQGARTFESNFIHSVPRTLDR